MNDSTSEDRETSTSWSDITLNKFIEPAAIITLVIAATYYVGQTYINSYYGRLGLDTSSLEFPTSFYVQQSAIPIIIGVAASYLAFSFPEKKRYRSNRKKALFGNILLFSAGLLILYVGLKGVGQYKVFYIIVAFIVLTSTAILTYLGISFTSFTTSKKSAFLFRLGTLVAIFSLFVLTAQALGNNRAVTLISDNKNKDILTVSFNWGENEPEPQDLNGELILLMQNRGNYYVMKEQALQSNIDEIFPEIYIIPESNIRFAMIKRKWKFN